MGNLLTPKESDLHFAKILQGKNQIKAVAKTKVKPLNIHLLFKMLMKLLPNKPILHYDWQPSPNKACALSHMSVPRTS